MFLKNIILIFIEKEIIIKVMKTREELRLQFFTENDGAYWTNSQEDPDIDYVHWLEDKLLNRLTIPVVVDSSVTISKQEYDKLKRDSDDLQKVSFSM